jgi:hypothetical protein
MKEALEDLPLDEDKISGSLIERMERAQQALRVVHSISNLAGNEIPIFPVQAAEDIPREPGIYLLPDYYESENPIVSTKFINDPKLLSGRVDSAHSVLAGNLVSVTESGESRSIIVAAKCSLKRTPEQRFERAITELEIMSFLYERKELGFKPIALAVTPDNHPMDGKLAIISKFDSSISTMDNLPWGRGIDDEDNVESAIRAATALGHFNATLGFQHNDAKIKNCASGVIGAKTGFVDFETTERFDPTIQAEASKASYVDFGTFIDSLINKGFFNHRDAEIVLEQLADAYLYKWVEIEPTTEVFSSVYNAIEEIKKQSKGKRIKHPSEL